MPRFADIEERLLKAKIFTILDVSQGFHHIKIDPNDRYKTGFVTKYDHYEQNVLPFGLKNAPFFGLKVRKSIKLVDKVEVKKNQMGQLCSWDRSEFHRDGKSDAGEFIK